MKKLLITLLTIISITSFAQTDTLLHAYCKNPHYEVTIFVNDSLDTLVTINDGATIETSKGYSYTYIEELNYVSIWLTKNSWSKLDFDLDAKEIIILDGKNVTTLKMRKYKLYQK